MAIRTRTTEIEFTIESKLTSVDSSVAMASHLSVRTMNMFDSEIYTSMFPIECSNVRSNSAYEKNMFTALV